MTNLFLDGSKLFHHMEEVAKWKRGEDFPPIHVEVDPTSACNHRCVFCYADHHNHALGTLERELFLTLMRDMGAMGVKSCLLAGTGEPLVNKHTIDAAIAGREAGVDMAVNSNAIILVEDKARKLLPHLTWIRFSVMGHDPETYAKVHVTKESDFDIAIRNISNAAEIKHRQNLGVTIGVQQVLLPENAHGVAALARKAKEMGVDYYVLKPFSIDTKNKYAGASAIELSRRFKEQLDEASSLSDENFKAIIRWNTFSDNGARTYDKCLGLPFISQISGDGKVYTCCPFFGNESHCLGDLREKRYPELWYSESAKAARKKIEETQNVHECMTHCRHHQINKQLWDLRHGPDHVNFI